MIHENFATIPRHSHSIVLADPPWRFASNSKARPGRNAMRHYACMTDADLAAMPVAEIAAKDALLFLWTTAPMLVRSLAVMAAWGFAYKSQLIWAKNRVGTGFWVRNQHEIVLIARRGKFPCPKPAPFASSLIVARQREHSRKPDALHERIEAVWPDHPKIELFARTARDGWCAFGNETGKFDGA